MRAAVDCGQSVQWIPFKGPRAITGKIPIRIVCERFAAAACDGHIVAIRRRVAVHIGRDYRDRVIARSDRRFSFKAVIGFNGRRSSVHGHGRWLICRAPDRHDSSPALPRLQLVEVVDCVACHKAVDRFHSTIAGCVIIISVALQNRA